MSLPRNYLRRTPPPLSLVPADSWRNRAACATHPTLPVSTWDDSIHNENDRQRAARVRQAQAVCADCPVAGPCAEDVDPRWDEGVRSGVDLRAVAPCEAVSVVKQAAAPILALLLLTSVVVANLSLFGEMTA